MGGRESKESTCLSWVEGGDCLLAAYTQSQILHIWDGYDRMTLSYPKSQRLKTT